MTTTAISETEVPVVVTDPAAMRAAAMRAATPRGAMTASNGRPSHHVLGRVDLREAVPPLVARQTESQLATGRPTASLPATAPHAPSVRTAANARNAVLDLTARPGLIAGRAQSAAVGAIGPELLAQAARLDRVVLETPVDETPVDETPVRAGERVPEKGALTPGENANRS